MSVATTHAVKIQLPINPFSANPTKWSNTIKQFVVFEHFVILTLKGLTVEY